MKLLAKINVPVRNVLISLLLGKGLVPQPADRAEM